MITTWNDLQPDDRIVMKHSTYGMTVWRVLKQVPVNERTVLITVDICGIPRSWLMPAKDRLDALSPSDITVHRASPVA